MLRNPGCNKVTPLEQLKKAHAEHFFCMGFHYLVVALQSASCVTRLLLDEFIWRSSPSIPILWARLPVVASQQLQIQDVDHPIIVQIRLGRRGQVVAHPNR